MEMVKEVLLPTRARSSAPYPPNGTTPRKCYIITNKLSTMAGPSFSSDEHEMKVLKDMVIFAENDLARFRSIKSLAEFGSSAVPHITEVIESSSDMGFRRYCIELLEKIKARQAKGVLGAIFAVLPCIGLQVCSIDLLPS